MREHTVVNNQVCLMKEVLFSQVFSSISNLTVTTMGKCPFSQDLVHMRENISSDSKDRLMFREMFQQGDIFQQEDMFK